MRAFWTWDPYSNNKWFFDKSVWQRMFRTMSGCGFDSMILAHTHPFPFMIDLAAYPDAKIIDDSTLAAYQDMHHWVFNTALDYGIAPYVLFFCACYPDPMADLAVEYTHYCVRSLMESYPELYGLFGEVDEDITPGRAEFVQQAIIDAVDAARPDASLYLCGCGDAAEFVNGIERRGGRTIKYSVKYTREQLVDANPAPAFIEWVEAAGAANVSAEFRMSNFEPWTSFSFDTVEGILTNLRDMGCDGFSLQPLSLYEWPNTSDTLFKHQFQRDLVWYSVWGGTDVDRMIASGSPKWLLRNHRLLPGFQAGSRIMELLALYFAGDRRNQWRPQFCSYWNNDEFLLLSIEDMLHLENLPAFGGGDWWREITGDRVVRLAEYLKSGTPPDAYGPDELIDELTDLAVQAVEAGQKGMRNASGEKELPSLARDALCMGRLGEFYVERLRAALCRGRGQDSEALDHMKRALGFYREIQAIDSSHRDSFRVSADRRPIPGDWLGTIHALETEYTNASKLIAKARPSTSSG